ncbi:MAG: GTP cyclohydrolase I FolE [Desulfurococcaceae archaeon]
MSEYKIDKEKIKMGVRLILEGLGLDLDNENFKETPERVADFFEEFITPKLSDEDYKYFTSKGDLVIVRDITAYTLCPHHLLPVVYRIHVAYIPRDQVIGVSKLVRVIYDEARRITIQEEFTNNVASRIKMITGSDDVMVVVRGIHYCMRMRGVKSPDAEVLTSAIRGKFKDYALRMETMRLMGLK